MTLDQQFEALRTAGLQVWRIQEIPEQRVWAAVMWDRRHFYPASGPTLAAALDQSLALAKARLGQVDPPPLGVVPAELDDFLL